MGWYGTYTKHDTLRQYVDADLTVDKKYGELLDRSIRGNVVYSLVKLTDGKKIIVLDLVNKDHRGFWMHKTLSEECHPYYYDCPERFLKLSTSQQPSAVEWREKCRLLRHEKTEIIGIFNTLAAGATLRNRSGAELTYLKPYNKSLTQIVCRNNDKNQIFRYSYKDFNLSDLKAPENNLLTA